MICNETLQLDGGYDYIREAPAKHRQRDIRMHPVLKGIIEIMRPIIDLSPLPASASGMRMWCKPDFQPAESQAGGRMSLRRHPTMLVGREIGT